MNIFIKSYIYKNKEALIIFSASLMLVILFVFSICVGSVKISLGELWRLIIGNDTLGASSHILFYVRFPRTLAAMFSGIALSASGAVLQTVLNNPMCSPNIIGVNSGAGLFVIAVSVFFPSLTALTPIAAFVGALIAVLIVYVIAKKTSSSKLTIVLSGIAVSSLLSAVIDAILTIAPEAASGRVDFLIGSFSGVTISQVLFAAPYIILALIVLFMFSTDMSVISLGDSAAASLGMKVTKMRIFFLIIAALLAGSAISLGGLIGFIGLIVPHIAKILAGNNHKIVLPLTSILGGSFCLICDIFARTLFSPFELPVGIIMSFLGSPFFIYLINKKGRINI